LEVTSFNAFVICADQGKRRIDGLTTVIRIKLAENFRAVFYAPFYATHALGFYLGQGVEVELLRSFAPGYGVSALLDGTVDITWGGPMRVIKACEQQPTSPLVCFCEVVARDPFYLIGGNIGPDFKLAALPSLRFAAVSEVPTPWMCLQHDLREKGVDPTRLKRMADQSMAENFRALCNNQLDVVQVFEPYPSMAVQVGAGNILYSASTRGPTVYTTFIATRDGIERHRTGFRRMVQAIQQTQAWLEEHSAEDLAEITASFFPNIARDILVSSLRRYLQAKVWARAPDVSQEGFARLAESLSSGGFIARMPKYEFCVDQSLC
jgi:NitT/TauT family transport system substrate-binding protein